MRVLMVTPGYFPIQGGTETVVHHLSTELDKTGVDVSVMTFNMDQKWHPKWRGMTEEIDGVTVFRVPGLNWLPMVNSPRVKLGINLIPGRFRHLVEEYDILHFHEAEFSFPAFSYFTRKPKILHVHGITFDYFRRYHLSRYILNHVADLYLSITKQMKEELAMLGIHKDKITYFPNSVCSETFKPGQKKASGTVLYVGRIAPTKGLHVLLKSLSYIDSSVHLVVIGPSDWSHGYHHGILRLIEDENKKGKHRITYLGPLNQKDIIQWYQRASVLALPSLVEGFGLVILEALSCETPVVSTYAGGIPEIVMNGENGMLVPSNDPVKLAGAIGYLLENKDIRVRFGKAGREWVMRNFSLEVSANKLYDIYEGMLNRQYD